MDQALQETIVATTQYAAISYERGLDIVELTGFIREEGCYVVVYGDPDLPVDAQRRTAVLRTRILEMDLHPKT